jgi:hypothetical protein
MMKLTQSILARVPEGDKALPAILSALPAAGRLPLSVHFFHDPLAGPDFLPADLAGSSGLGIASTTPAAFARYADAGETVYSIAVVEYADATAAQAALKRCLSLRASKRLAASEKGRSYFEAGPGAFTAFLQVGSRVGSVVRAKGLDRARKAADDLAASLASQP